MNLEKQFETCEINKYESILLDGYKNDAYGHASLTILKPNLDQINLSLKESQEKLFDLASITKLYTTAIILRLAEYNALDLQQEIENFLPSYSGTGLKFIDLLSHNVDYGFPVSQLRKEFGDNFHSEVSKLKVSVTPLGKTNYNNLGFIHLGIIIEQIYGNNLGDVLRSLFEEYNLTNTFAGDNLPIEKNYAPTEIVDGRMIRGITHDETARLMNGVAGHAGIFSTSQDVALFGQKWMNYEIVSQEFFERHILKNYDEANPQSLGFWLRIPSLPNYNNKFLSHSGFTGGLLALDPETQTVISILNNRTIYGRDNQKHKEVWGSILAEVENS
jgi:serine-type D-Ala-D-Ala carboxypeptidase